jgi:hypothetical protein
MMGKPGYEKLKNSLFQGPVKDERVGGRIFQITP